MTQKTNKTTEHSTIKKWAESRGGKPSVVLKNGIQTENIRLSIPGTESDKEDLQEISWTEWFNLFEENQLELIYQIEDDKGNPNNFYQLVKRNK